jgi:transcriptional regulator with XRE-family HTH domain
MDSGKTQCDIAERAGMHESQLSAIKRGRRIPNPEEKAAIARALRKRIQDLFPDEVTA